MMKMNRMQSGGTVQVDIVMTSGF